LVVKKDVALCEGKAADPADFLPQGTQSNNSITQICANEQKNFPVAARLTRPERAKRPGSSRAGAQPVALQGFHGVRRKKRERVMGIEPT
jgi:hypothetical protein